MAQNTSPIFALTGNITVGATITTANTAKDGTGTVVLVCTGAANGTFIQRIRARANGTNVATVLRLFINNGSTNTTAANNTYWDEITLSATANSEVASLATYELPLNFVLPNTYRLYATIGTTVVAGYALTCIAGDY